MRALPRVLAACAVGLVAQSASAADLIQVSGVTAPRYVRADLSGLASATVTARYVRNGSSRTHPETLLHRYPLKLTVGTNGRVAVQWTVRSTGRYELVSSAPAAGDYTVKFSCDTKANVWQLTVNGRSDMSPAYGKCVGTAWGRPTVGGATLSNQPIKGKLALTLSSGGSTASTPPPEPEPSPSPDPSPTPTGSPVLYADHAERNFSDWPNSGMVAGGEKSYSQQVVAWNGNQVGRFEVREGQAGPNKKVRSEVGDKSVDKNSEWWYSWRTQIPHEWKDNNSTWYVTTQFHQAPPKWRNGDWGPPPLKFGYSGGQWHIHQWFYDLDHPKSPIYKAAGAKGVWVNWRVHAVWSGDRNGVLQIWRDGKLVVDRRGKNLNGDGGGGTFLKLGIYRGHGDPNTQVVLHDDYRRGRTRESVN